MKYHHIGILSMIIIGLLSCSDKTNYKNYDLDIISEKINGIWIDKDNMNDTVLIFSEINENKTKLTGLISNDFEITETGFKTSMDDLMIKIDKTEDNTILNMYSHNLSGGHKSYVIEFIDDNILKLADYKQFRKLENLNI